MRASTRRVVEAASPKARVALSPWCLLPVVSPPASETLPCHDRELRHAPAHAASFFANNAAVNTGSSVNTNSSVNTGSRWRGIGQLW